MTVLDEGDVEVFSYIAEEEVAGFDPVVYDAGICEVVDMTGEDGEVGGFNSAGDVYGAGGGGLV